MSDTPADNHTLTLRSPAKINLHLEISTALTDNKHELRSLFCPLELHDEVQIEFVNQSTTPSITTTFTTNSDHIYLPQNDKNSVIDAIKLFWKHYNISADYKIDVLINKHIPAQAGLAGGSSNAATVLKALHEYHKLDIKSTKALTLAAQIGSDVPFFLHCKPSLWGRFGEEFVADFSLSASLAIALIKPDFGVSTVRAYKLFDELNDFMGVKNTDFVETQHLIADLNCPSADNSTLADISQYYLTHKPYNSLQQSAFDLRPALLDLYTELEQAEEVLQTQLSGSGSTIFCICESIESAKTLSNKYSKNNYWTWAGQTLPST